MCTNCNGMSTIGRIPNGEKQNDMVMCASLILVRGKRFLDLGMYSRINANAYIERKCYAICRTQTVPICSGTNKANLLQIQLDVLHYLPGNKRTKISKTNAMY